MQIYEIEGITPKISPDISYIADNVVIIGDVEIEEGVTIFDNVVLEGYPTKIHVGRYSNIQSGTMVHGLSKSNTIIGEYNTIGHRCVLHGCNLEDYVMVGMGSVVMAYTTIGMGSLIGSASIITEHKEFPPLSLIYGHPAEVVRKLDEASLEDAKKIAETYSEKGKYLKIFKKRIS